MRTVLVDPSAPGHLKLQELPAPVPLSNQALVQVEAISLNLGEVRRARRSASGTLLGWDVAGTGNAITITINAINGVRLD